jgi:hypothetical protein
MQNLVSFEKKTNDLLEHLEVNLTNEQIFGHEVLDPFSNYSLNTLELKRRQEKLPSPKRIKKVKSCSQKKVENLHLIVKSFKQVISKKNKFITKPAPDGLCRNYQRGSRYKHNSQLPVSHKRSVPGTS